MEAENSLPTDSAPTAQELQDGHEEAEPGRFKSPTPGADSDDWEYERPPGRGINGIATAPNTVPGKSALQKGASNTQKRKRATYKKAGMYAGKMKPHRRVYKLGTGALERMKTQRRIAKLLERKEGPFPRLVRELTQDLKSDLRWEAAALEALKEASEAFLVKMFGCKLFQS
ncbi:hypothetical protein LTR62_007262 [Meristemomyces frigidus]|uniref:Core Histone H2A/H2B/H3 domain-containing protein n=1 Tax=Meristemomyces frigidus TaxID=1508187 RepID=A0AAN7YDP8_9PEZI|nr:hypothetical protein LTR62_007262 [Meristemomyces frigidus]